MSKTIPCMTLTNGISLRNHPNSFIIRVGSQLTTTFNAQPSNHRSTPKSLIDRPSHVPIPPSFDPFYFHGFLILNFDDSHWNRWKAIHCRHHPFDGTHCCRCRLCHFIFNVINSFSYPMLGTKNPSFDYSRWRPFRFIQIYRLCRNIKHK